MAAAMMLHGDNTVCDVAESCFTDRFSFDFTYL